MWYVLTELTDRSVMLRVGSKREAPPLNEEKQSLILKAATEVFCEQGFESTSMQAIAERAGVAKGTLYLYYPSKGDLIEQVFIHCNESDVNACQQGLEEIPSALGKLCRRLRNAVRWAVENPEMSRIERLILASPRYQHGRYCEQTRQREHVDKILKEGIERGELRDMPRELMGEIFFGIGRAVLDHISEYPAELEDETLWKQCEDCICGCLKKE